MVHERFVNYLQAELADRCKRKPTYSLRAFAQHLKTSHATLSQVLNGKRPLTRRLALRMSDSLGLSHSEVDNLLDTPGSAQSELQKSPQEDPSYQLLRADHFHFIADWYHLPILELLTLDCSFYSAKEIAQALDIHLHEAKAALQRLERLSLIKTNEAGEYETRSFFNYIPAKKSTTAGQKRLQKQILEKSLEALDQVDISQRSHSSISFSGNREKLEMAKQEIKKFRRRLQLLMDEGGDNDQVFQLQISLFPLIKEGNTK